jgi:sporulation protein YlmC with PRC-barrel domain
MTDLKIVRTLGAAALLTASIPAMSISALAQTPPSEETQDQATPAAPAEKVSPAPSATTGPAATPEKMPEAVPAPSVTNAPKASIGGETTAAAPMLKDVPVGAAVFGSDGKRLGKIEAVKSERSGTVDAIHVHVGGFFGFGGKTVEVPASKISKSGTSVQVTLTSTEVDSLPPVAGQNG